jgi:Cu+-exporting ATPase
MCAYYDRDDASGVSMRARTIDATGIGGLDDPDIAARFSTPIGRGQLRITFSIPTMHCASCVWLLERLERFDAGIVGSRVDLMRRVVSIDIDTERTTVRRVAELLASLGYEPDVRAEHSASTPSAKRSLYLRLGVAGFAAGNTMLFSVAQYLAGPDGMPDALSSLFQWLSIALSIPVLVYSAAPWYRSAWGAIKRARINLDVPVTVGILAIFAQSTWDVVTGAGEGYFDSFTGLLVFLLVGRLFQQRAFDSLSFDRTYRSFFPLSVRLSRQGAEEIVPITDVKVGDVLHLRNGEILPCDAVLTSEAGYIDYSFMTGESRPVECVQGSIIRAGGKVVGSKLEMVATRTVSHAELSAMWERSSARDHHNALLGLGDSFGRDFTYAAFGLAAIGFVVWMPDVHLAIRVMTAVLIIACPCALTLAAPITLGTAMGLLGRRGIYVKHVGALLDLERADTIVFDKTGTLTTTHVDVEWIGSPLTASETNAISAVAAQSVHPVSRAIAHACGPTEVTARIHEELGAGIEGTTSLGEIVIGSRAFMQERMVEVPGGTDDLGSTTYVAIDGAYRGGYRVLPTVRAGLDPMMRTLAKDRDLRMLSGDSAHEAAEFEPWFGNNMQFRLDPSAKADAIAQLQKQGRTVAMIGDGLNDAAAMGVANVALAVSDGTSTIVPACDVIVSGTSVPVLHDVFRAARALRSVILTNLIVSMVYNAVGLSLALTGSLTPVAAAVLMPVSSLTVIGLSVAGARWYIRRIP